ncbi:MAG TPA: hypothetical protein VI260_08195, partial [Blastocatellia bacterium]
MRFNPKALIVALAAGGFIFYAADHQKKQVVAAASKSAVRAISVKAVQDPAVKNPKMPVAPSIEDFPELWSLQPLKRPA